MKRLLTLTAVFLLMLSACKPEAEPATPSVPALPPTPQLPQEPSGGSPQNPDPEPELRIAFVCPFTDLYPGETAKALCEISGGAAGESYKTVFTSSDASVASVSSDGTVTAHRPGSVVIRAGIEGSGVYAERKWHVVDLNFVKQAYSRSLVFVTGHTIYYKSVMQSWDFFDDYMYVCQISGGIHSLSFTRKPVLTATPQAYMHLKYFGHGDNCFVERCSDGDYLWVPNYGTLESGQTDRYTDSQVLSRVRFQNARTMLPEDSDDNYIMPGARRIIAAYDEDNGNIGIWFRDAAGKAWFYIYNLEKLKEAPSEDIRLSFDRRYASPVVTDRPVVRARDLSKLPPLMKFAMPLNNVPQGYDFHHGKIWFFQGDGAESDEVAAGTNANWARVSLIDMAPKVLERADVPWVADLSLLDSEGITNLGYFEPEGIKVKDGVLYLGFASKDAGSSPPRRINFFKYPLP